MGFYGGLSGLIEFYEGFMEVLWRFMRFYGVLSDFIGFYGCFIEVLWGFMGV